MVRVSLQHFSSVHLCLVFFLSHVMRMIALMLAWCLVILFYFLNFFFFSSLDLISSICLFHSLRQGICTLAGDFVAVDAGDPHRDRVIFFFFYELELFTISQKVFYVRCLSYFDVFCLRLDQL